MVFLNSISTPTPPKSWLPEKVIYEASQCVCWLSSLRLFLHPACHLHWRLTVYQGTARWNGGTLWWQSILNLLCCLSFFPCSVYPSRSTDALLQNSSTGLLSLTLSLLFPFSPRTTRRRGMKGMREFQESSGRLAAVSTNDVLCSSWGRVFWGSSRQYSERYLSGLWGWFTHQLICSLLFKTFCPSAMPTSSTAVLWLVTSAHLCKCSC